MNKNIIFYIARGLLSFLLIIYVVYLLNLLVGHISVVSRTDLLKAPEIATFNFKKFEELKITK